MTVRKFFSVILAGVIGFLTVIPVWAGLPEQRLAKLERQMRQFSQMMLEMRELRSEQQRIFGQMEEITHKVARLEKQLKSQYLELSQQQASQSANQQVVQQQQKMQQESESAAYRNAFALVRANKTQQALGAMNQLIQRYPNGVYAGDAWFWIARLYAVEGQHIESRRAFDRARSALKGVAQRYSGSSHAERAMKRLAQIPSL